MNKPKRTSIHHTITQFDKKSPKNNRIVYYSTYAILFCIVAAAVFFWFRLYEKSFIWAADGLTQHFIALAYFGEYLRAIIGGLLSAGTIEIPLWDFHIGHGSDILTTLHYYVIGDPLALLSVFVPLRWTEQLYNALIILRIGLAGAAFSAYCHKMGRGRFPTLCAAFAYAFCAFVLLLSVMHPFFTNPMIYLPLLLLGAEKILRKERPYLFICMVFLSLLSNFYFFYMLGIFVLLYVCIRLLSMPRTERHIDGTAKTLLSFAIYTAVGILMACVLFIPQAIKLFAAARWGSGVIFDSFYHLDYYKGLLFGFITPTTPGGWASSHIGITPTAFLGVLSLFSVRRQHRALKVSFLLLTLFLLFPLFGYMLNGFAYVSNRWLFGYIFLIAFILATMLPHMLRATAKQLLAISVFAALYLIAYLTLRTVQNAVFLSSFAVFAMALILLWVNHLLRTRGSGHGRCGKAVIRSAIFLITIIGILVHAGFRYSATGMNYTREFVDTNQAFSRLTDTEAGLVSQMEGHAVFRYDYCRFTTDSPFNAAIPNRVMGTGYFFSLNHGTVSAFAREILLDRYYDNLYRGHDNRAIPSLLASVRYFVVRHGSEAYVPYGYTRSAIQNDRFLVYENLHALPLGYTYTAYIPRARFEQLTPLQRQAVMLQGAVLDESPPRLLRLEPSLTDADLPFEMEFEEGIAYQDGAFIVTRGGAQITLRFTGLPNSETYLYIENLRFHPVHPLDLIDEALWEDQFAYELNVLRQRHRYWTPQRNTSFTARTADIQKHISIRTPYDPHYFGKHDFLVNMGYSTDPRTEITLSFFHPGTFTFDALSIVCQPMDQFPAQAAALGEYVLENIEIDTNRVRGSISLSEPRLLALSIPFSNGWTAYVNGEQADLLQVNTMHMGLLLEGGQHHIELRYRTPGLTSGLLASAAGFALFAVVIVFFERRRRKSYTCDQ